ncbi:HNH endonuclease [Pleomorphomonas oryzae]|uniref:HNH endonuclease n=1 Tax=Pleomorphomonas oryzae TaxID=261934 RepID=UPI00040D598B|nr:HNH endonuclease [Pleomorphomonas oryzae]
MSFGVFIHRFDSIYDDSPAERYQFPAQYLGRVSACVGDWIVYYEPRKIRDTRGYFAVARVARVVPDAASPGMYVAEIEPGSYLDFVGPVPFSDEDGVIERGLLNEDGGISGRAQSAVRPISATDFDRILARGFHEAQPELPRIGPMLDADLVSFGEGSQVPFIMEQPRLRVDQLTSRIVRDRLFRRVVLRAYDKRCAVTGLRLINGGGRAEVDAAHIRPVEANGPDILSNGLALSGTAHWMFDRGLIGLADDFRILVSRHVNDPDSARGLINASGHAIVPPRPSDRPSPHFLKWHRDNVFKV